MSFKVRQDYEPVNPTKNMTEREEKKQLDQEEEEVDKVNVDELDAQRQLFYYAKTGDIDGVKKAKNAGADVNAIDTDGFKDGDYISRNTALHYACDVGNAGIVSLLLDMEADIEKTNKLESTPLHIAASHGYIEVVEILLKWKANINAKNKIGNTALHCAVYAGHVDVVRALLKDSDNPKEMLGRSNGIGYGPYKYCAHDNMKACLRQFFQNSNNNDDNKMDDDNDDQNDDQNNTYGNGNNDIVEEQPITNQ
eukprot:CAMPEP_0114697388 /NCGR_PEP_ID=MMETSP0191-20121206/73726_1 /TAXON_ID=126664 /ORGANISM="Sorites sp." /LENGTH=251 /DNA_ID=CAMNT_0001996417 /DNA_START=1 /DNA_END=756 /DNA_ORIENTATION=-